MTQRPEFAASPRPEGAVSVRVIRNLLHTVEQAGVPQIKLLHAAQIDPEQLGTAEARLPRELVYRLCELAVEVTGDPAFGLHWAERLDASAFPPISHLVHHVATLRMAFETLERYQSLVSDNLGFALTEQDGLATVLCSSLPKESLVTQRFVTEMVLVGLFRLVRLFNPRATIQLVSFAYGAPTYRADYERVFGSAARFDQPFTGIVFDAKLLSSVSPYEDAELLAALRALGERRVMHMSESAPYAVRVRDVLVQHNAPHSVEMSKVARALGVSERSLRRRLAEEGKPFNVIADEACALVLKRLFLDQRRTIQEAAFDMGFSSTTAFHRAFKRWTSMTPSAFRKEQRPLSRR
jgi:AraC-like DNA-binding protein